MAFVMGRCSNCSEKVYLDDARERGYCLYCGSPLIVKDAVAKLGPVAASAGGSAATEDSLIKRGYMEIEKMVGNTDSLVKVCGIFERALDINPNNYLAWKGIYLANLKSSEIAPKFNSSTGFAFMVGAIRCSTSWIHEKNGKMNIGYRVEGVKALEIAIKVAPPDKKSELQDIMEQQVTIPLQKLEALKELVDSGLCAFCKGKFNFVGICKACGKYRGTSPYYDYRDYRQ